MSPDDELLTLAEVRDILRVSRRTMTTMVSRGDIRTVTVASRAVRILRSELTRYLRACDSGGPARKNRVESMKASLG